MKLSNKGKLPKPYVVFVEKTCNNKHNEKGCYSATTLIAGVKSTVLKDRHFDEIEADVMDFHAAVMGTAFHYIMESCTDESFFKEEKLEYPVSHSKVTGRFDLYDMNEKVVYDWKTCNAIKHKIGDYSEWEKQALVYAWLFSKNNLEVNKVVFVADFKDFSSTQAENGGDYPRYPIQREFEVTITKEKIDEIEKWIIERVKALELAETQSDDEIERCSNEEVWARGEGWAVTKKTRKTALRVLPTEEEARKWMQENGGDDIEYRPPVYTRCERYCTACKWCNFYKNNVEK